jgi:general secretion pathway protein D
LSISPQISAADYITLTYQVTQSAFIGSPTSSGGAAIPPPKRSDSVSSIATIPDGYVIGLGGLSTTSGSDGESRVPLLGQIPLLGNLFKSQSHGSSRSKFYIFIRANILREENFQDLRYRSDRSGAEAGIKDPEWPTVEPRLIK